ncbi:MAG: hypothetical protein ABSA83_14515 [Verrucomicrobiota bacterium]
MKLRIIIAPILILLCLSAAAGYAAPDATPVQTQQKAQLEQQQQAAARTAQTYKAMDNAALINKLVEQSARKREPFNSLAYRELVTRKDVDSKVLVAIVDEKKNGDVLLPLLLLRKLDEKTYSQIPAEARAGVLTDALEQSKTFNAWGLPNFYLEDASKALLESGESAYPQLRRMLSQTRPAPIYGSKAYMIYKRYQFRLCDYALFFLKRMHGEAAFELPASVSERDGLIKDMLK